MALMIGESTSLRSLILKLKAWATALSTSDVSGLGTAAAKNTGTSGNTVPLLDGANTWSGTQTFSAQATFNAQANYFTSADYGTAVYIEGTSAGAGGPLISTKHNSASPANFDTLLLLYCQGKDSGGNTLAYCQQYAQIVDTTDGSEDGRWAWNTVIAGAAADRFYLGHGFYANGATGGDKGDGTINAKAVYDDNTLLTCYVFDAALDGKIDVAKWDAKVEPGLRYDELGAVTEEPRQHEPVRKFAARLGGDEDPLNLEKYIAHWRDKRHLTSMPNEQNFEPHSTGEWVQRLVETVEIQAVHIAQLHERLKALGG